MAGTHCTKEQTVLLLGKSEKEKFRCEMRKRNWEMFCKYSWCLSLQQWPENSWRTYQVQDWKDWMWRYSETSEHWRGLTSEPRPKLRVLLDLWRWLFGLWQRCHYRVTRRENFVATKQQKEEISVDLSLMLYPAINSRWTVDLNIKVQTKKLLEENTVFAWS